MATAAELVLSKVDEIKKSFDEKLTAAETREAALKTQLEKSNSDLVEFKKSFEEKQKEYDSLVSFAKSPDYGDNSPYKLFAQPKQDAKGEGRMGFKSFSHFCHEIREAGRPGGRVGDVMKSWMEKAPSALNETVGAEGGFLVPPTFASEIWMRAYDNSLWEMTTGHTAGANSNSLTFNAIDETSRADGSRFGGVRAYWDAEANQATTTKPAYNQVRLQLHKLLAISYATEELIQDSGTALEQHLFNLFSSEIKFKLGDSLINGTGAGMPLGVLNAAATVSVSKETGQAAATIVKENIDKMWSRMWAPSRANAVWLINQDVEPALFSMAQNVGTGGMPVYLPPGGLSAKPYGTLYGRPVIPTEFNATLGTVGDIVFVDFKSWYSLRKGDTQQDTSIHLRFDYAETAFRTIFRADARPIWLTALTPFKGSATKSPAITLATRA
jgi:HK97 family phage major capsid protein